MARLKLDQVSVAFPVYNGMARSLRSEFFRAVGGTIQHYNRTVTVEALKNISLDLCDGDRLALVGHNGAGKTTLLRVLAGVYPPTAGSFLSEGKISSLTHITMGMNAELSGTDNIITRLVLMGLSFAEAKALVPAIAAFSELDEYLDLPMRTYSTGMHVRLAFAVATCVVPEILILDEMISAGDARFIEKARLRTQEFVDKAKIMVLATHDTAMLRQYCNKALWLEHGVVKMLGGVEVVCKAYEDNTSCK